MTILFLESEIVANLPGTWPHRHELEMDDGGIFRSQDLSICLLGGLYVWQFYVSSTTGKPP